MSAEWANGVEINGRLLRMERELRRGRVGAVVALGIATVAVLTAMAGPENKELRVQTLRIVDDAGKDRIVLTAEPNVPDMTFLDPSGQTRLTLDIAEDQKPVLLFNDAGHESNRLSMGIEDGTPTLQLYDASTKKRLSFVVPKGGIPMIRIFGEDGKLRKKYP